MAQHALDATGYNLDTEHSYPEVDIHQKEEGNVSRPPPPCGNHPQREALVLDVAQAPGSLP